MVFALEGICSDELDLTILLDYRRSSRDVYVDTAWYLLTKDLGMCILPFSRCGYPGKMQNLPSWVPDWSWSRNFIRSTLYHFDAETSYACEALGQPEIWWMSNPDILVTRGICIDKVTIFGTIYNFPLFKSDMDFASLFTAVFRWHQEALNLV